MNELKKCDNCRTTTILLYELDWVSYSSPAVDKTVETAFVCAPCYYNATGILHCKFDGKTKDVSPDTGYCIDCDKARALSTYKIELDKIVGRVTKPIKVKKLKTSDTKPLSSSEALKILRATGIDKDIKQTAANILLGKDKND